MSNPISDAIAQASRAIRAGARREVFIDPTQFEPPDEMDRAAIIAFFEEPE